MPFLRMICLLSKNRERASGIGCLEQIKRRAPGVEVAYKQRSRRNHLTVGIEAADCPTWPLRNCQVMVIRQVSLPNRCPGGKSTLRQIGSSTDIRRYPAGYESLTSSTGNFFIVDVIWKLISTFRKRKGTRDAHELSASAALSFS